MRRRSQERRRGPAGRGREWRNHLLHLQDEATPSCEVGAEEERTFEEERRGCETCKDDAATAEADE